jgi:hypothetical protein
MKIGETEIVSKLFFAKDAARLGSSNCAYDIGQMRLKKLENMNPTYSHCIF